MIDGGRQEVLLAAADAGAAMIDVTGDLYDPPPMELVRDPEAIHKQKALIDKIHAKGAEAVISSHVDTTVRTGSSASLWACPSALRFPATNHAVGCRTPPSGP